MKSPVFYYFSRFPPPTNRRFKGGGGNKMVVGTVMKAKVGELEGYVRYFFNRIMRSCFTGVLGVFNFNKMILVIFEYWFEK